MIWLFSVIIVALMGVFAVVAVGQGGEMAPAFDDRVESSVPRGRLGGSDLKVVRFSMTWRGYRPSEVDALLSRLAQQLDSPQTTAEHE